MECRSGNPGQHGQGRSKNSEYGLQLREKQKAKRYYGVLEKQFRGYYELAERRPGQAGQNLLAILESRLDNVIYRLGFAMSRAEARQLVTHGHFTVNGRKVNIPSYLVKPGMVITLKDSSRSLEKIKSSVEANAFRLRSGWSTMPTTWLPRSSACPSAKISTFRSRSTSSSSCTPSNTPVRLVS